MTEVSNKKWNEWGELVGVIYSSTTSSTTTIPIKKEDKPVSNTTNENVVGSATVNDTRVALREYPSTKSTILTRVDKG
jgi:hypothetical protein